MSEQVYKDMVGVMASRSTGMFGGLDIPEFYDVAKVLFNLEEAVINNAMPATTFSAAQLGEIMGRDAAELEKALKQMADKGLCTTYLKGDLRLFRSAQFVPGIFEFVMMPGTTTDRDKELAKLILAYKKAWEAENEVVIPYPMQRVITVEETIESGHQIHTYDQVKTYIEQNEHIAATACYCRHAALLRGEDTHGMPMQVCFSFGKTAQYTIECLNARVLSKEEAYKVIDECKEAGLVHMTHNTTDDVGYLCNCDQWHCYAIQTILKQPHPAAVFNSGFEPKFDPDRCTACETCLDRCPANALVMGDQDLPEVDLNLCFGCAACATGCNDETITMITKPAHVPPPKNNNELMQNIFAAFTK